MANSKISGLSDGNPALNDDQIYVNRGGADTRVTAGSIAALGSGPLILDRTLDSTTSTGTGDLTLAFTSADGFKNFSEAYTMLDINKRLCVGIRDDNTGDWENSYVTLGSVNKFKYSDRLLEPDTILWDDGGFASFVNNSYTAPDGTLTATKWIESAGSTSDRHIGWFAIDQEVSITAGANITYSCYVKPVNRNYFAIVAITRGSSATFHADFLLTGSGSVAGTGAASGATYVSSGVSGPDSQGYYRVWVTGKFVADDVDCSAYLYNYDNGSQYTGVASQIAIATWGMQIEEGTSPTTFHNAPHLLENRQPLASSNGNALVNFAAGTKSVFLTVSSRQTERVLPSVVDIVADYGADPSGLTGSNAAFSAFTVDYASAGQSGTLPETITLNIPPGTYWLDERFDTTNPFGGIDNIAINAYGATFIGALGWGNFGFPTDGTSHSAKLVTTTVDAFSVTLATLADNTKFAAGDWVLIASCDTQGGNGYPPNPYFYEYHQISTINTGTGVITLLKPIKYAHKSTFPEFVEHGTSGADSGGPATIYRMTSRACFSKFHLKGATFNCYDNGNQIGLTFRDATFEDCVFNYNIITNISVQQYLKFVNCTFRGGTWEVDKSSEFVSFTDCDLGYSTFLFQSANPQMMQFENCDMNGVYGTGKNLVMRNCRVGPIQFGNRNQAQPESVLLENCNITSVDDWRSWNTGVTDFTSNSSATFTNGIFTGVKTEDGGSLSFQTPPGAKGWVQDTFAGIAPPFFEVLDVKENANPLNYDIHTTLASCDISSSEVDGLVMHPCPRLTVRNCYGCPEIEALSQAPDDAPLWSYQAHTQRGDPYDFRWKAFGELVMMRINVVKAYTGSSGTLTMTDGGSGGGLEITTSAYVTTALTLTINLKIAGERVIVPDGTFGAQSGDTLPTIPAGVMFNSKATGGFSLPYSASIAAENPDVKPIVEIELWCDQGIVAKRRLGGI